MRHLSWMKICTCSLTSDLYKQHIAFSDVDNPPNCTVNLTNIANQLKYSNKTFNCIL